MATTKTERWLEFKKKKKDRDQDVSRAEFEAGELMRSLWHLLARCSITVAWAVLVAAAWGYGKFEYEWTYLWWVSIVGSALLLAGFWKKQFWNFAPISGDIMRQYRKHAARRPRLDARNYIVFTKLVKKEDAGELKSTMIHSKDKVVLHWRDEVEGKAEHEVAPILVNFKSRLKAVRAHIEVVDDGMDIVFYKTDPLDNGQTIHEPKAVNLQDMSIPVGVDSTGEVVYLKFKNKAASLIGGASGRGKTAAVSAFLTAFAKFNEYAELHILDNKGGSDWSAYEPVAKTYLSVDGLDIGIAHVAEFAEELLVTLQKRVKGNLADFGVSNWWEATPEQHLAADSRFLLVVIDECQELFDKGGKSKDEKDMIDRITGIFTSISKRGRSAGIHLMFITQKPTADAIPSAITNQCGIRVALGVDTPQAETAILGEAGTDLNLARATQIPSNRPGGAVFADENGNRVMGRFYFFPETEQREYLKNYAKKNKIIAPRKKVVELDPEEAEGGFVFEEIA